MKLLKKIAMRILANELAGLNLEREKLQRMAYGSNRYVIPQGVVNEIMRMLPAPNKFMRGEVPVSELVNLEGKYEYTLMGEKRSSVIKLVPDERNEKLEQGLMFQVVDFKLNILIPLAKSDSYSMSGVSVESWVWDFYRSGIRIVSDDDFGMILEFITKINNMNKEKTE